MDISEYIEAVETGYHDLGLGRGVNVPRENLWIPGNAEEAVGGGHLPANSKGSFKFKAALLHGMGSAGVQAYTAGLPRNLETYLFLFDANEGHLTAIMEVLYYDWLKTAAVAAVASRHLAPEDSACVAIFGTGRHARSQLHALCATHPIQRVQAYSRTRPVLEDFCTNMTEALGIEVVPAESPQDAIHEADIITTITTSPTPVFNGMDLPERPLHINAMGAHYPWVREIDEWVVLNSCIILDDWQQGLQEHGEILIPMQDKLIDESRIAGDLGQVVAGQLDCRNNTDSQWTLFLSGGTGAEDVAVATRLYERAAANGIGTEFSFGLPYEFEL